MRALVVLNPGSGTVKKLGIDRGRERVAAICKANNLTATIALVPGSRISERIKDELASSQERAHRNARGGTSISSSWAAVTAA
jgi:hypothetical protein